MSNKHEQSKIVTAESVSDLPLQEGGANAVGGHRSLGTSPCNTVPSNSITPSFIVPLVQGIDTLYLSYQGQIDFFKHKELSTLKDLAKSDDLLTQAYAIYNIRGHQFEVRSAGSGIFPFVLKNNAYLIKFSGTKGKQMPLAQVQIRSAWLLKHGVEWVCRDLLPIIEHFGDIEGEAQVSRADLYLDFVSTLLLDALIAAQWVSRAVYIGNHTMSRETTGYSIGRGGDITFRLYDKTKELEKSGKEYMKAIWQQKGWEPEDTVWRAEFQYMRPFLKERGIETVPQLLERLGSLWTYSTLSWLKLTIPSTTDSTQSRWPLHPTWSAIADIEWNGSDQALSIPVRSSNPPTEQFMYINGIGGYTSYLVLNNVRHSEETFQEYYRDTKKYHDKSSMFSGADFQRYVNEKAAIKAKKCNLPFPEIEEKSQHIVNDALGTDPDVYRKMKDGE